MSAQPTSILLSIFVMSLTQPAPGQSILVGAGAGVEQYPRMYGSGCGRPSTSAAALTGDIRAGINLSPGSFGVRLFGFFKPQDDMEPFCIFPDGLSGDRRYHGVSEAAGGVAVFVTFKPPNWSSSSMTIEAGSIPDRENVFISLVPGYDYRGARIEFIGKLHRIGFSEITRERQNGVVIREFGARSGHDYRPAAGLRLAFTTR